jgi:hypothetical protein
MRHLIQPLIFVGCSENAFSAVLTLHRAQTDTV